MEISSKDAEKADSFDGTITTIGENVYTLVAEENEDVFKTNNNVDFSKKYVYNEEESELERTLTSNVFYTDYGYGDNGVTVLENVFEKNNNGEITEGYIFNYGYQNENISSETLTVESKAEDGSSDGHTESLSYEYDDNDQLTKATSGTTEWTYEYDSRGNIITKTIKNISTDNTVTYTYNYDSVWQDRLISYNGQEIKYALEDGTTDNSNPLVYRGNALTWTMGRQLASFGDISYTYNEEGIRTSKTVNSVKTTFLLNGYNIIEQTDGTITLHFFYDSNNEVIGFRYNGNDYFYVKNAMSDIIAITDSNKNIVVEYRYDPWGDILSTSGDMVIGNLNPFRYRSYYYDSDIEMYYLQSRYYDAEVGRFINCDDVNYIGVTESEVSYNPFAYCNNSPVNDSDLNGHFSWKQVTAIFNEIIDDAELLLAKFYRKYHKSRKAFAKMTKYKKADKVYEFVYKNSSKIKKFGKTISGIGTFLSILLAISEVSEIINKGKSYKRMILHIVYCGGLRFAQCVSEEIIPYIVGTICQPLIVLNYAVKRIVTYAFTIFENSKYNETINTNFINYLMNRDFTPDNVIRALFYGVKYCFC